MDIISISYINASEKEVSREGSIPMMLDGGEANLKMSQNFFFFFYSYKIIRP